LRGLHLEGGGGNPLPVYQQRTMSGHRTWQLSADWRSIGVNYDEALFLSRPAPVLDMTAHMLVDLRPSRSAALTAAAAGGASVFAFCLFALVILQRRVALRQRLALEAQAKETLEAKVADRTAALTAEVAERRAAEAALRAAQGDLVQAGKMSALGNMAAGIAHELNQPLSAIRGFADNARVFLERDRSAEADENLGRISDLTNRAARIIKNLRAFARNAPEPTGPIDLVPVVDDAVALMAARARVEGNEIRLNKPQHPVLVEGGVVRLQQVLVNLLSNALDAMKDTQGAIDLTVTEDGDRVFLAIRDQGEGLGDDIKDRVFDPFFSTKTEAGEGMGLGLSISYGIIRSFGGELRAENHPDGGAIFTIEMKRAAAQEVAA
jgi:two-component system, NtrC family, C4-dicarboxylate transport sensor histidine kinase DctB